MNVLLVRFPPKAAVKIAQNPYLQDVNFHVLAQHPASAYPRGGRFASCGQDFPRSDREDLILERVKNLIEKYEIQQVIATQKLFWYSNVVERACKELGVSIMWSEAFFDGKMIFDRAGLPYTKDNELFLDRSVKTDEIRPPKKTREPQPAIANRADLYERYGTGCFVVFGQVPTDMALVDHHGTDYQIWLDKLFRSNPQTNFLFKHHPLCKTRLRQYGNVEIANESVIALFETYSEFASFSSTVIYEGLCRGKKFVTGGRHFCDHQDMVIGRASHLFDIRERLIDFQAFVDRRLSFVQHYYTIDLSGEKLRDRIMLSTLDYLEKTNTEKHGIIEPCTLI